MGTGSKKRVKKGLDFWKINYGIKAPYNVLCDGEFLHLSLKRKLFLKTYVPNMFHSQVTFWVTKCVVAELRSLGPEYAPAAVYTKGLQRMACPHDISSLVPGAQCLKEIATAPDYKPHYFFALSSLEDRQALETVPGVPLMHIAYAAVKLVHPSDASKAAAAAHANTLRLLPSEAKLLQPSDAPQRKGTRKKKTKGPAPLASKKRKPKPDLRASKRQKVEVAAE